MNEPAMLAKLWAGEGLTRQRSIWIQQYRLMRDAWQVNPLAPATTSHERMVASLLTLIDEAGTILDTRPFDPRS